MGLTGNTRPRYGGRVKASTYLIALGSNRFTSKGTPHATLTFLLRGFAASRDTHNLTRSREAAKNRVNTLAISRIIEASPVGPGTRSYANAVALIETDLRPPALLAHLKSLERAHGRRPGRRWGDRPLDLDIIGWSSGIWSSSGLAIPHPAFRARRFVLAPLVEIAPDWRDPVTRLTARQLLARLDRKRPRA